MARYAHMVAGKIMNFIEWDGVMPFDPGGQLVPEKDLRGNEDTAPFEQAGTVRKTNVDVADLRADLVKGGVITAEAARAR